jgi:alkylation response protein AidB-like acyl-CoA dehydrogenase
MDFSLTDQQKLIRDTVRQFVESEVRPTVKERDRTEQFPAEEIRKIGELGCCGMLVPEEWGGAGLDHISYVLMLEEVARVDTAMSTSLGVTNSAVQLPLLRFGGEAQKKKYLSRLSSGKILGSFCLTEPQAGSDAAGIQARAVRTGDVYKLQGTKTWVTNGSVAGVFIIFAKTNPEAGGKGITAFLAEPGFAGLRIGRHEDKMGQRCSPSVEIILDGCEIPAENRRRRPGPEDCAERAGRRTYRHRRASRRIGARRAGRIRSLREATQSLRQKHCRVPSNPVDAGRHADGNRSRARIAALLRVAGRRAPG